MRRLLLSLAALRLAMATGQAKADYIFTTPLDPPDSRSTNMNGSGINASGLIVGDYLDADTRTHGYLLSGGLRYTRLSRLDLDQSLRDQRLRPDRGNLHCWRHKPRLPPDK